MTDLTDDDRAAIDALHQGWLTDTGRYPDSFPHTLYLAGLRAGLERAARICEVKAQWDYSQPECHQTGLGAEKVRRIAMGNRCDDCAQDIRAAMGE